MNTRLFYISNGNIDHAAIVDSLSQRIAIPQVIQIRLHLVVNQNTIGYSSFYISIKNYCFINKVETYSCHMPLSDYERAALEKVLK